MVIGSTVIDKALRLAWRGQANDPPVPRPAVLARC
jgi:hypothetical protein